MVAAPGSRLLETRPARHREGAWCPLRGKSPAKAIRDYLAYMARDAASPDGRSGGLFNQDGALEREAADAFAERGLACRHQFRFIVSPQRGGDLDLERFAKDLVHGIERDLRTRLDVAAAVHDDTNQPHIHLGGRNGSSFQRLLRQVDGGAGHGD